MKAILLTPSKIDEYLNRCIDNRVAAVWNGCGTALFLELGRLHRSPAFRVKKAQSHGDVTVMLEWDWRIEASRSIVVGSCDSERLIKTRPQILKGQRVQSITATCRLPEISIGFSNKLWLHSFTCEAGQSQWTLIFHDEGSVCVQRGRMYFIKEQTNI